MTQKIRILLTGDTGFLGELLYRRLTADGFLISRLSEDGTDIDISHPFSLRSRIYDIVVHCAGKAHSVPKTEAEIQSFYDVNEKGTKNLCAAIEQLPQLPEAFIFISTVAVYGVDEGVNISERHPLIGITPYAKSKINAEKFLQEWAQQNEVTLGILRLPLVAGPNPPGNLGAMIKGIRTGRYLSINKGEARKSVVWAEDIAGIIPKLAEVGGIYNITDGYHPAFSELGQAIASALKMKSPKSIPLILAQVLGKIGDILGSRSPINSEKVRKITATLTFDDSSARSALNWEPTNVLNKIGDMV